MDVLVDHWRSSAMLTGGFLVLSTYYSDGTTVSVILRTARISVTE